MTLEYEQKPCASCQAPMVWAITLQHRRIPINPEPEPNGNLEINGHLADGTPTVRYLKTTENPGGLLPRYVAHFATCPAAAKHRR